MIKLLVNQVKVPIEHSEADIKAGVEKKLHHKIKSFEIRKRSLDARKEPFYVYSLIVETEDGKHLLSKDVLKALNRAKAPILYVCNIVTQPGETDGYSVSDHLHVLNRYLKPRKVDIVLANNTLPDPETAIRYQGPMRNHITENAQRGECMADVRIMPYREFVKKWAKRPTLKLLAQKYLWGNRQKVWLWNILH